MITSHITCETGNRYESRQNPPQRHSKIECETNERLLWEPGVQLVYPVHGAVAVR